MSMDQDIQLGKIAGISIGFNWSILAIFFFIAWELADLVLPSYHPVTRRRPTGLPGLSPPASSSFLS